MRRDRAVEVDEDVAKVARFMECNVAADRLHYVACRLPEPAALICSPDRCAVLYREPMYAKQPNASESVPAEPCVGDGSVVEVDAG